VHRRSLTLADHVSADHPLDVIEARSERPPNRRQRDRYDARVEHDERKDEQRGEQNPKFGDASAPRRKHREIVDEVLSRGTPVRWFGSGLAACETASDDQQ
jgi:hypothetical protein